MYSIKFSIEGNQSERFNGSDKKLCNWLVENLKTYDNVEHIPQLITEGKITLNGYSNSSLTSDVGENFVISIEKIFSETFTDETYKQIAHDQLISGMNILKQANVSTGKLVAVFAFEFFGKIKYMHIKIDLLEKSSYFLFRKTYFDIKFSVYDFDVVQDVLE